jgi:hypothetical protein
VHREIKENLETANVSAELKELWCQRGPMFREGVISFGKPRIAEAELCEGSIPGMGGNGMTVVEADIRRNTDVS